VSLFRKYRALGPWDSAGDAVPMRYNRSGGTVAVTNDTALRHSAVWACLRLRANLVSTMPVDAYRNVSGINLEIAKPPVLVDPGGERVDMQEWLYSSQVDLDRAGNTFGLVTERAGTGLPARIDLQPLSECSVIVRKGQLTYRFQNKEYDPYEVWHERQYTVSGCPIGLSPVAYAAWTIGEYLSIQEFAINWFGSGGMPKAQLRNVARTVGKDDAVGIKARFKSSVENGDIWVTGNDWEYKPLQTEQVGNAWIEAKQFGIADVARFFDCPGDLIDAAVQSGNITYASITQRNLQFLIMHLGPTLVRRELALSKLLPKPRFVKFNTDALLRMDPKSKADTFKVQIDSRTMTPTEARAIEDRAPLTAAETAEFELYWPTGKGGGTSKQLSLVEMIQKIYLGVGTVITWEEARVILNQAGAGLDPSIPAPDAPDAGSVEIGV
jgi:HK97 family phage portal protein